MSTNNLQKKLWWIIGILIGLNLLMPIGYFLLRPKPPKGGLHPPPSHFLEKELDFDKEQMQAYRELRNAHRKKIDGIHKELSQLKRRFFGQIKDGIPSDSLLSLISQQQQQMDRLTFKHFSNVRENICTEAQRPDFDEVLEEVFRRPRGPRHGPPK